MKQTTGVNEGQGAQFQFGKASAHGETDLAVALLGFASSPGNQAALKTARVTPRSESSRAALSTTLHLLLCTPDGNPSGKLGKTTAILEKFPREKGHTFLEVD